MALLSYSDRFDSFKHSSNYNGNSSGLRIAELWQTTGTGRQSTIGWFELTKLQKILITRNYYKDWSYENRGMTTATHNEAGPSQTLWWTDKGPYASSLFPSYEFNPDAVDIADRIALNKLWGKLKGEGANIANMVGERNQVLRSCVNAVHGCYNILVSLKRGDIASAVRYAGGDPRSVRQLRSKDIAEMWLALQYGWKPLLSDVYDLVNGLHKRESEVPVAIKGRHEVKPKSEPAIGSSWFDSMTGPQTSRGIRSNKAIVKYTVIAMPDLRLAEPAALGLTDPLTVLWEVTPWSFVVDWFLPVGQYLEQLSATHGWIFWGGCKSVLKTVDTKGSFSGKRTWTGPPTWTYTDTKSWNRSSKAVSFNRTPLTSWPMVRPPAFKNPFSTGHLYNSLALLYQAFGPSGRASPPPGLPPVPKYFNWGFEKRH